MSLFKSFRVKRTNPFELMGLAAAVGIERRQNFRITYAPGGAIGNLPSLTFMGNNLRIENISMGGCCLLDGEEVLGPAVGQDVTLSLHWVKDSQDVRCRIVSRVHQKRHIQFLNLSDRNRERVRHHFEPAYRGSVLRRVDSSSSPNMKLEACEIWVSNMEDAVTLFDHPHLRGSVLYRGVDYFCYRGSIPVFGSNRQRIVSEATFENVILMLSNVANASQELKGLLGELCDIGKERFR